MINAVGRNIPDYLLVDGKEVYQGRFAKDGQVLKRDAPTTVMNEKPVADKLCASIREACEKCGAHDGMTISFHHAFRNGDYTASMVCKVLVEEMGIKDLRVAATSLGDAHNLLADYIEQGIIVQVQRELGVPVKLIGLGEGADDLAPFDAHGFVDAIVDA